MFLTDHFFSEQQKAELLGSSYGAYVAKQRRKKQLEQIRLHHLREIEIHKHQMQLEQQIYDKKSLHLEWIVLAVIIFSTLMSGVGMSFLLGEI